MHNPVVLTPAAIPGNFFSAAFENSCLAVAGASGGIFGMIGLYIADMILNFESIKRCVGDRVCVYAAQCHSAGGGFCLLANVTGCRTASHETSLKGSHDCIASSPV